MMKEKRATKCILYAGILLCFVLMFFFIVPQSDMFLFARDTEPTLRGAALGAYNYGNGRFLGNLIGMFLSHRFVLAFLPLALCLTAMILILSLREGKFHFEFTFWRTLICLPIAMVAIVLFQLLRELRKYPPKLSKQSVWTMEELMALTGKDRKETERIITRILEACFTVDERCILKEGASAVADGAAPAEPVEPAAEEKRDGFSRFDS